MKHMSRKSLAALGLAVAGFFCFFAAPASAQIPVTDGAHIGINKLAWVEQYRQMYSDELNQLNQIRNQVQMIQEMQVNGLKFESPLGPRETNLQRRGENEFVEERCASLGGNGLSRLFTGGANGSERVNEARLRQYAACNLLVRLENKRYNRMVDVAEKLREHDRDVQRLQAESRNTAGNERGRLDTNDNAILVLNAAQVQEMEAANRDLQMYDQQINVLKGEMALAGQTAFSNKSRSLFGQAVQYGTLKIALEGARRARER